MLNATSLPGELAVLPLAHCAGRPASAPGSAPTTSTRQGAFNVHASSSARRLSSRTACCEALSV